MPAIAAGGSTSPANPVLVFYAVNAKGRLQDLFALDYEVWDVSTDAKRLVPVVVVARTAVNLVANKLGTGRYAPTIAIGGGAAVGMYEIRYFWKFLSTDVEKSCRKDFEVVASGASGFSLGPAYAFLADMREEGILSTGTDAVSDARLQVTLVLATRYVESVTKRFFEPRYVDARYDGTQARALMLNNPIIGLETLAVDTEPGSIGDLVVDESYVRVYNRHLVGMSNPDDRDAPKLEFVHTDDDLLGVTWYRTSGVSLRSLVFPAGVQNVTARGVYGYTELDSSPWGQTPALIRHVTKLLVLREMVKFTNIDCREDWRQRWRIKREKTRDQEYELADPRLWGGMVGDPEIDSILAIHMRPPNFGSA